jgi:hypothetical protein
MGPAAVRFTGRAEGDLGDDAPGVEARRRAVVDRPWSWLRQVHGAGVRVVRRPGAFAGEEADAMVSAAAGAALSIKVADCAPVALVSPEGVIGAAHAGWSGLVAGVIPATVDAMRRLGATEVAAALGPCIHRGCYEFGARDLDRVAVVLGDGVRSTTARGTPALDLPAAVREALGRADASLVHDEDVCTACSADHWSHRGGPDPQRQAMVVWLP